MMYYGLMLLLVQFILTGLYLLYWDSEPAPFPPPRLPRELQDKLDREERLARLQRQYYQQDVPYYRSRRTPTPGR
jgi:hypothetical protein